MNTVAKMISDTRKLKGLTQDELAVKYQVNLRTIQRIETNKSEPQGKTLNLICEAFQIDIKDLETSDYNEKVIGIGTTIVNWIFLIALNLILMGIIGFLMFDSNSNLNSRFGGLLISIFLPFSIVILTKNRSGMERILKFGFGYIVYFIMVMIMHGFPVGFVSGFFPCLLISLSVLYYGQELIRDKNQNAD